MHFLGKIHISNLPVCVQDALCQILALDKNLALTDIVAQADLIVADKDQLPEKKMPGLPLLALNVEVKQRLGAILRKIYQILEEPSLYLENFTIGAYVFSPQDRLLSLAGTKDISLTDREVDILVYLAKYASAPVSREALLKNVWRYQDGIDTHTLETHIYRLRQKMESVADHPLLLQTTEGGYLLNLEADKKTA